MVNFLMSCFCVFLCYFPVREDAKTNSELVKEAMKFLQQNQRDSVRVIAEELRNRARHDDNELKIAIADYFYAEGILYKDPNLTIKNAQTSLGLFEVYEEWEYAARASKSLGNSYSLLYEYNSAIDSYEKGLSIIRKKAIKSVRLEALLNYGLGSARRGISDYEKSIKHLQFANELSEEIGDSTILISSVIEIAAIFFEIENFGKSREYFSQARSMAQSDKFKNLRYFIDNGLAHIYKVNDQLDSAMMLFQLAYENAVHAGDEINASIYLYNIADLQLNLGELDSAKSANSKMKQVSSRLGLKENLAFGHEIDSRIFSSEGKHEDAINSAIKSVNLSQEIGDPEQLSNANRNLYEVFVNAGRHNEALEAFILHDQISDSLLSIQNIKVVEELETKYETEKKDNSIEKLTQQNQIQDLELSKQRLWLFVSLTGVLGLILLALVFYILNKKRSAEQAKESEDLRQKLLRIQLNPHFTYNALNAIQSMVYENKDKQKTADYLSNFSSLMRNILELNQRDYITLEEELDFMENYIEVQQMRFDNSILYHITVDNQLAIETLLLPPMITQPFLENSFEHGFPDKSQNGNLWIGIGVEEDWLAITIKDNGVGLSATDKKNKEHNSLATKITEERLANISMLFKRESGISIHELYNEGKAQGTEVIIKLPLIYD